MFLVFLIKNICLLSFYFAYSTIIFSQLIHRSMIVVYFVLLACFSLSYGLRYNKKYVKFKYLSLLGFAVSALYLNTIVGIIVLMPVLVYMAFMIKNDEYQVHYYDFKSLFINLIVAILPLPLIANISGKFELFTSSSLPYALVFLVSGFYLLRTVRHSKKVINSKKFILMNVLVILVSFSICLVLSSDRILSAIIYSLDFIFVKTLFPLLMKLFYAVFNPITKALTKVYDRAREGDVFEEIAEEAIPEVEDIEINYEPYMSILYVFSTIFLILTVALIIYRIKYKKKKIAKENIQIHGVKQYRSSLDDDISNSSNKKEKQIFKGSVEQIRYWYKKFLALCHKKNMDIFKSDSSQTIYEKSSKIFVNSEQELKEMKEIYRKARYSNESMSRKDVKAIKNICKDVERKKYKKV